MIENAVLTFTFNGERYKLKLDTSEIKKVASKKSARTPSSKICKSDVLSAIEHLGYGQDWVDVTELNKQMGEKSSRPIAHILEQMGYTDSFRIKRNGKHHYIRYSPFLITDDEIRKKF